MYVFALYVNRFCQHIHMGFLDFLGEVAGSMAAKAQVLQNYKKEYEEMSDNNLK